MSGISLVVIICVLTNLLINLLVVAILLLPRRHTRWVRHKLARAVMWQWRKMSKLSAIVYAGLWQRGNGNHRRRPK